MNTPNGYTPQPVRTAIPMSAIRFNTVAVAAFIAVIITSGLVLQTSRAAFTAQTTNDANSFAAGALTLTHDAPTSSRFSVSGWVPGDTATRCIEVEYTGTASSNSGVRFFAANLVDVDGAADAGAAAKLSDDLDVVVSIYAATETCLTGAPTVTTIYNSTTPAASAGTLEALAANHTGYANGLNPAWTPAASPEMRAFRIVVTLGADTADNAQGDSATVDFTWEIQAGV